MTITELWRERFGVDAPRKIICVGLNYREHAAEGGRAAPEEPILFGKFATALLEPGAPIVLPREDEHVDSEAELAVVLGRGGRRIAADDALDHVAGYTVANDVSARTLQRKDGQWLRAKGFDTFCPVGELGPVPDDLSTLRVRTLVNGEVRQDGTAADMVFDIPALVAYISAVMTLEPGDLVLTGTPEGVGTLSVGDVVEVEVVGVSRVSNPVTSEP